MQTETAPVVSAQDEVLSADEQERLALLIAEEDGRRSFPFPMEA